MSMSIRYLINQHQTEKQMLLREHEQQATIGMQQGLGRWQGDSRYQPGMSTSRGWEQDLYLGGLWDDQGAEGEGMGGYGREEGGGDAGCHHGSSRRHAVRC